MPGIKPVITEEQIVTLLQQHFPTSIEHLAMIHSGQIAQTFSFTVERQGVSVPAYDERLRRYHCYISLDALRFFAKSNQPGAYQWTHNRIFELIR